jgi:hypothetical protein
MQKLAGIKLIKEAKSNDYYKKGMMSQNEGEAYGGYEDIMPKQRLAILQKLLAASEKDLQTAPGPTTQEVIDHLKQAIEALKGSMALSEVGMFHDPRQGGAFTDETDKWEKGAFHVKVKMLKNRNITNASEMVEKYKDKPWEQVKRELKLSK